MRYWRIECGNGYCGCDEQWVAEAEEEPTLDDVLNDYSYTFGCAGLEIGDDESDDITEEDYYENLCDECCVTEITEEEYWRLRNDEFFDFMSY